MKSFFLDKKLRKNERKIKKNAVRIYRRLGRHRKNGIPVDKILQLMRACLKGKSKEDFNVALDYMTYRIFKEL